MYIGPAWPQARGCCGVVCELRLRRDGRGVTGVPTSPSQRRRTCNEKEACRQSRVTCAHSDSAVAVNVQSTNGTEEYKNPSRL
eukprot:scaffold111_cov252-Pinguiococcus_pyrenoidosus.AAC.11